MATLASPAYTRTARIASLVTMVMWMLVGPVPGCLGACSVQLVDVTFSVREGEQLTIDVLKTGTAASPVNVVMEVGGECAICECKRVRESEHFMEGRTL